jgi:hypothetical protein
MNQASRTGRQRRLSLGARQRYCGRLSFGSSPGQCRFGGRAGLLRRFYRSLGSTTRGAPAGPANTPVNGLLATNPHRGITPVSTGVARTSDSEAEDIGVLLTPTLATNLGGAAHRCGDGDFCLSARSGAARPLLARHHTSPGRGSIVEDISGARRPELIDGTRE